jgi:hypothetical protein
MTRPALKTTLPSLTKPKEKEEIKMRAIRYYVINKAARTEVYTNCSHSKCVEHRNAMADKENYCIGYKWLSI